MSKFHVFGGTVPLLRGRKKHTITDIDKTLAQIEDASNSKTDLAADETLILRG